MYANEVNTKNQTRGGILAEQAQPTKRVFNQASDSISFLDIVVVGKQALWGQKGATEQFPAIFQSWTLLLRNLRPVLGQSLCYPPRQKQLANHQARRGPSPINVSLMGDISIHTKFPISGDFPFECEYHRRCTL